VAVATFAADRITKAWLIEVIEALGPVIEITGFFNLVHVWNTGVSFSMLQLDSGTGRWLLSGLALVIVLAMIVWLGRSVWLFERVALGLIVGGALGNVTDRLLWGAVADFFDFHAFGYHWPAFNVADSAIVVGVAVLLLDTWIRRRMRSEP
jgi:signal peptidase II